MGGWVSRCKTLYMKWINDKVPLYSKDNYIQHPIINNRKECLKNVCVCVCVCITESFCRTAEVNTIL